MSAHFFNSRARYLALVTDVKLLNLSFVNEKHDNFVLGIFDDYTKTFGDCFYALLFCKLNVINSSRCYSFNWTIRT